MQPMSQDLVEVEVKVQNREEELKTASNTSENLEYRIEHARKGIEEQTTKRKRAAARLNLFMRELRERAPYVLHCSRKLARLKPETETRIKLFNVD